MNAQEVFVQLRDVGRALSTQSSVPSTLRSLLWESIRRSINWAEAEGFDLDLPDEAILQKWKQQCIGIRADGGDCQAMAMRGQTRCHIHADAVEQADHALRRAGEIDARMRRAWATGYPYPPPDRP